MHRCSWVLRRILPLLVVIALLPPAAGASPLVARGQEPSAIVSGPDIGAWLRSVAATVSQLIADCQRTADAPAVPSRSDIGRMVGQKLLVRMNSRTPSRKLLGRIERGEIGGIVLLGSDVTTRSALRRLTGTLQGAATAGGQPPLLIAIDQEGGSVKRVPWIPPTITVPRMGEIGSAGVARSQGRRTGKALLELGINVDLAPVADIPRSTSAFMYQQGRTFGFDAGVTARLADAFASGLADAGVLATMKHFPGIGLAIENTDHHVDVIRASRTTLARDLQPYRRAIGHDLPLIMLSNATYTAYDPDHAAGWSRQIGLDLLRRDLGFRGVTMTDSLDGTGHARGLSVRDLGLRASVAGTDILLTTGSERTTARLFDTLVAAAEDGTIPSARLQASYDRILSLKGRLARRSSPASYRALDPHQVSKAS